MKKLKRSRLFSRESCNNPFRYRSVKVVTMLNCNGLELVIKYMRVLPVVIAFIGEMRRYRTYIIGALFLLALILA